MSSWLFVPALLGAPALADTPADLDAPVLVEALPAAEATPAAVATLAYDSVGFDAGGEDRIARGPEELAVGADGWMALADPVNREVIVLWQGDRHATFAVDRPSDLLFTSSTDGDLQLLVLDDPARRVQRWSTEGDLLQDLPLPGLVPSGGQLLLDAEGRLSSVDLFGNQHTIAQLGADGLIAHEGLGLEPNPEPLLWDARTLTYSTPERSFALPEALAVSGQRLGDWLVLDVVTGDAPITVERTAVNLATGSTTTLPASPDRAYLPQGDLALDPDSGALLYLDPGPRSVSVQEVQP